MDGIFISYRRDDSAGYAGRLYDRLIPHFGAERVFMDVEGIEPGADFVTAIEDAVGSCRVLIVIIGDEWLTTLDGAGRRRLDDPHDFIRLETVTALKRGIRVVPVLVGGALMPRAEELPADLGPLARRQAIEISHKQWEATTAELIRALEVMLGDAGVAGLAHPAQEASRATGLSTAAEGNGTVGATVVRGATPPTGVQGPVPPNPTPSRSWRVVAGVVVALLAVIAGGWIWRGGDREVDDNRQAINDPMKTAQAPADHKDAVVAAAPSPPAVVIAAATPPPAVVAAPTAAATPPSTPQDTVVAAATPPTAPAVTVRPSAVAAARVSPPRAAAVARAPTVATARPETVRPPPDGARPTADTGAPRVGESWTYRTSGKWPTSPKRNIVISVQSVANGVVTDGLSAEGLASDSRRSNGARPMFMSWPGIGNEFSPYLAAFVDMDRMETMRGFATPDMEPNWSQWYSEAKLIGQETVNVPAGSFQAHKVEVWSSRHATGGTTQAGIEPVRVHYLIWYAPGAKRYVKMQRRILSASGTESERDVFELVARR